MPISKNAKQVLAALVELQRAGFITGGAECIADGSYPDNDCLIVKTPPVVTFDGFEFIEGDEHA